MLVRSISLEGFRNLVRQEVRLSERLTVVEGDNGEGKTNLLEAIYLLASLRSFRTSRLTECIAWDAESARVLGNVERHERHPTIEVRLVGGARRVRIDGKALRSVREFRGDLNAVVFAPEDLALAKRGPDLRRRLLDRGVFTTAPAHLADLLDYERALRARNALLRADSVDLLHLEAQSASLAVLGARIIGRRLDWIRQIAPRLEEIFGEIAAIAEVPTLTYEASTPGIDPDADPGGIEAALQQAWRRRHDRDLARGFTSSGPHADDLALSLGQRPLRIAGSQGQQRAYILALKLAEIRLARERLGEPPVLLLDDVGSELDEIRRGQLFGHLDAMAGQVVVTTTSAQVVPLSGDRLTLRTRLGRFEPSSVP